MINRALFYKRLRSQYGSLTKPQVSGIEAIFDENERRKLTDFSWLAYILATVWHETAKTMQPVREKYNGVRDEYYFQMYDIKGKRPHIARQLGNINRGDGVKFAGKGHTQNTGRDNYRRLTIAAKKDGHDWNFLENPELLLFMEPSIWATFHAMITGLYTGKSLKDYFKPGESDPRNARRIVNGIDRADLVESYHNLFLKCLTP